MIEFEFKLKTDKATPEELEAIAKGGELLRCLCGKEVDLFDAYLRQYGREYADGLAKFERLAIEGYLYQKARGHIDATTR